MKKVYLLTDTNGIVKGVTFEKNDNFYCEVEDNVTIKKIEEILELKTKTLMWKNDTKTLTFLEPKTITKEELKKAVEESNKEKQNLAVQLEELQAATMELMEMLAEMEML